MQIKKDLEGIDYLNSTVQEIEIIFSDKILGHTRPTIKISPEGLFRLRIITNTDEKELETTKSIWYPNFAEIKKEQHKLNRCSDIGQNFFYSSNSLETVIKEINPKNNDIVLVGTFFKKFDDTKISSQFAGIEALKKNSEHNKELKNYKYKSENDKLIEEYISSIFQKKIKEGEEYKYKPTIAFSNILLKNDDINCIIYPSVASNLKSVNYGIKAKFVDDFLYCHNTYIFKVKKDSLQFQLIPERYSKNIIFDLINTKNSVIQWQEYTQEEKKKTYKYSL